MQRCPQFITGDFEPHHKFLPDDEYGRALDSLVKACSDVLVVDPRSSRIYLGKRCVEPQPDWWYIGGRVKPGDTPQQGAARNVHRELGLDLPSERFAVLANYSFVWQTRTQPPICNGTADISTIHVLELTVEEAGKVVLDPKEYSDAGWFDPDELLVGDFHPALKMAVRDLQARNAYLELERAIVTGASVGEVATVARALVAAHTVDGLRAGTAIKVRFDKRGYEYEGPRVLDGGAPAAGIGARTGYMELPCVIGLVVGAAFMLLRN